MRLKFSLAFLLLVSLIIPASLRAERVRVPEGTPVRVRLKADLKSDRAQEGDRVDFEVARPVISRGVTVIPVGAQAWGAVQSAKDGKYVRFDIEGVRLPNMAEVKLRCAREKTKKASKDMIKAEADLNDTKGAARGSEYTAYVDDDVELEGTSAPAPAVTQPAPAVAAPAPAPAPAAPTAPAVSAPAPQASRELITVECFSDPSGADILLDGEFFGTTNSILKLPTGTHKLQFQRSGYVTFSQTLDLTPGMMLQTIRTTLEKRP